MKKMVLFLGVVFIFVACETGTKYKKDATTESINRSNESTSIVDLLDGEDESMIEDGFDEDLHPIVYEEENLYSSQQFSGGTMSDGLNVKNIRKGSHRNYERLVFDVATWSAYGSMEEKRVDSVGSYSASYNPAKKLISVVIHGYRSFTAPLPSFSRESMIEKIYFEKYQDDSGYKFHIKLKKSTEVKVFDLKSPARMVFDIKSI